MKILVVNCGSSSLKYQLIDMDDYKVLANGKCDKIGVKSINMPFIEYKGVGEKVIQELDLPNHTVAFEEVVRYLTDSEIGVIKDLGEIDAIGHRFVHGGSEFTKSVIVTDDVLEVCKKYIEYAPIHNPANLQGIEACRKIMPEIPQALVFDTAFHTTIPEHAALYAIPYEYYEKYGIKKYGFHGTSHKYITESAAKKLGKDISELNIISCHLGNGSSVAAVKGGKSVDTSMGLTPLEGLIMGTRSGDLDPAVLEFVMKKEGITIEEMINILNKKSGMLGISGITGDVRDLKQLVSEGNERAKLALDMFAYKVRKTIGSYMVVLGHVDAIIFTGGIGEYNPQLVEQIVSGLEEFGIEYNNPDSKIKVMVIPTNEELKIAEETMELVK